MVIKKYLVNNMNEAMTRIRYELGKDAVIISQRKIRKPGIQGLFSPKIFEVTAAVDKIEKKNEIPATGETELQNKINKILKEDKNKPLNSTKANEDILKEMHEMKNMINTMIQGNSPSISEKTEIEKKLLENDIQEELVNIITAEIKNDSEEISDTEKLRKLMKSRISISTEEMKGTVVLVGPTGVGKTTTIAKLAGKLSLMDKKSVGLITVDTYRIGAVEQLKTYADIMNIPFKVVFTLKDMETALTSMKNCDIILVDTTGRSSKNKMQISELRAFVNKTNSNNINLVLSSTTKNKDVIAIIDGYKTLNFNKVIITKLDETSTYGSLLNILNAAEKPLSYITTGQSVPEDIKIPTKEEVINLIMGEGNIC